MAEPVKMQRLSKFAETSEVLEWLKSPGEAVQEGEPLVTVLSDKATVEVPSPASGILLKVVVGTGDQVPAGTVLAWIGQPGEELEQEETTLGQPAGRRWEPATGSSIGHLGQESGASAEPRADPARQAQGCPSGRRLAAEHGIPLADLTGSGPETITVADVERRLLSDGRSDRNWLNLTLANLDPGFSPKIRQQPCCLCRAFDAPWLGA
jgi:pyruvate/2-oxoglutarate dehydrogenase complex dihydrolipoamide acyltransferase (E2) component